MPLWALAPMLSLPDDTGLPTAVTVLEEDAAYGRGVGRAIAHMHLALAHCPYDIDRGIIGPEKFARRWERLHAELPAARFETLARRVDPRRERVTAALTCAELQRLHGDCHGGNFLVQDGRVTGILDVDNLQLGPPGVRPGVPPGVPRVLDRPDRYPRAGRGGRGVGGHPFSPRRP